MAPHGQESQPRYTEYDFTDDVLRVTYTKWDNHLNDCMRWDGKEWIRRADDYNSYNLATQRSNSLGSRASTTGTTSEEDDRSMSSSVMTDRTVTGSAPLATSSAPRSVDPAPRMRYRGENFFQPGRMFACEWHEAYSSMQAAAFQSTTTNANQQVDYYKRRIFIVYRSDEDDSSMCFRLNTYSQRGVGKPRTVQGHHVAVYSEGLNQVKYLKDEREIGRPGNMLGAIRHIAVKAKKTVDPRSRVNVIKLYPVEHNINVTDMGKIHDDDFAWLKEQHKRIWAEVHG